MWIRHHHVSLICAVAVQQYISEFVGGSFLRRLTFPNTLTTETPTAARKVLGIPDMFDYTLEITEHTAGKFVVSCTSLFTWSFDPL